jgi:hypothetical protein
LDVILIPSRIEYKKAKCDLWWSGKDFFNFQESAISEVRLLSSFENIGYRDARQKLYQPSFDHSSLLNNFYCEESTFYDFENSVEENMQCEVKKKIQKCSIIPKVSSLDYINIEKFKSLQHDNNSKNNDENNDDFLFLSFCVPSNKLELLSTKEKPSRRKKISSGGNVLVAWIGLVLAGFYFANFYFN